MQRIWEFVENQQAAVKKSRVIWDYYDSLFMWQLCELQGVELWLALSPATAWRYTVGTVTWSGLFLGWICMCCSTVPVPVLVLWLPPVVQRYIRLTGDLKVLVSVNASALGCLSLCGNVFSPCVDLLDHYFALLEFLLVQSNLYCTKQDKM